MIRRQSSTFNSYTYLGDLYTLGKFSISRATNAKFNQDYDGNTIILTIPVFTYEQAIVEFVNTIIVVFIALNFSLGGDLVMPKFTVR